MAGVEIMNAIHTLGPNDPPPAIEDTWKPEKKPSAVEMAIRGYIGNVKQPFRWIEVAGKSIPGLARTIKGLLTKEFSLSMALSAPRTRFNAKISSNRVVEGIALDLARIKEIKTAVEGAKVNDVMLTIVGGALRRYLDSKGELPETPLVAMAPISVRSDSGDGDLGNQVSAMLVQLGTHIADPDTWFTAKYTDVSAYGTKAQQYEPLERMLDEYPQTQWLAAHMGGYPENLEFLSGLLERHDNLSLDTSACKWQVRELSKHPRDKLLAFFNRWKGRILFGSDIVARDEHLVESDDVQYAAGQAACPEQAFELYASRYYALRTMFETDYEGKSPIADPDLAMVEPDKFDEMSSPMLIGKSLPPEILTDMYSHAVGRVVARHYR